MKSLKSSKSGASGSYLVLPRGLEIKKGIGKREGVLSRKGLYSTSASFGENLGILPCTYIRKVKKKVNSGRTREITRKKKK